MTPNQALAANKSAHIIPAAGGKSSSVAVAAAAAIATPRATTIVSTTAAAAAAAAAQRKRENGKFHNNNINTNNNTNTNKKPHTNTNFDRFFEDFRAEVVQQLGSSQRPTSPISRPGSSDGSTTVSATSSPGIDQQEQEELNALYQVRMNTFFAPRNPNTFAIQAHTHAFSYIN